MEALTTNKYVHSNYTIGDKLNDNRVDLWIGRPNVSQP